jgi:hypothetical protein
LLPDTTNTLSELDFGISCDEFDILTWKNKHSKQQRIDDIYEVTASFLFYTAG